MSIDLRGAVSKGVDTIFSQLDQIVEDVVINRNTGSSYDPTMGEYTGQATPSVSVEGMFLGIDINDGRFGGTTGDLSSEVQVGDKVFMMKKSEISSFELTTHMTITRSSDSSKWLIVDFKLDPTDTLYEIQLRRSS